MFSIGTRGRFGNYNHHGLALARQKQDFGNILTRVRAARSDETSSHLSVADELQDHDGTSQTALKSRQVGIPLSRLDSSESLSRQDIPSFADLSEIDRTRELVKLILDTDYIKRNLVASEFLMLTETEFQGILDDAAAILRDQETLYNRAIGIYSTTFLCAATIGLLPILFSTLYMFDALGAHCEHGTRDEETEQPALLPLIGTVAGVLGSIGVMQLGGYLNSPAALRRSGEKIRELRNQFREFCASIRESGLRRVCCTDTPCSISKESITRFFTYAGLAGAFVVGAGVIGASPCLEALNNSDGTVRVNDRISLTLSGNCLLQPVQLGVRWASFLGTYVCNLGIPLIFMTSIFSGLKQDVMELFCGARYRNERVQNTAHNLRALLARLLQDHNTRKFVEDLMNQKYTGSPELMLMDYVSKMELDADALEMSGVTQDILDNHGLERTDLAVFCSTAKQIMDALPDRTMDIAEAMELINDLRFDVSFRNKVLSELKFEDARYSDGWVRFTGGARTLTRLGLGWLAMNTFFGTFSSRMIVRHYRHEARIAENATLSCALFANKTIIPFDTVRFHAGVASSAAHGVALSNAAMNTLDTGWIMLTMGCSGITTRKQVLPRLKAAIAGGKMLEFLDKTRRRTLIPALGLSAAGTALYAYTISLSCQTSNDVIMLRECPIFQIYPIHRSFINIEDPAIRPWVTWLPSCLFL